MNKFIFALITLLSPLSVSAQTTLMPPTEKPQDLNWIQEELEVDTPEARQNIINKIYNTLHEKTEASVLNEFMKGLSVAKLQKLYKILIEATDYEWTENFAEKVWQALSLKIKLESVVLYDNPRINLIAVSPGERQFVMELSDGSIWEVADHLSGDPEVDLVIIRGLLGQYTEVEPYTYETYSYRITALGFPEIQFNGYMQANKISSLSLENKDIYQFGELYN